ncbi:MAG: oxygen-dependent coproporphyrinogen oxidase [Rickettsiaceae bacterium]|nr:oxygen-dependent coproporphyrinogen oxidase [Rickettsiaceae bacterium]
MENSTKKEMASAWFENLRNQLCSAFEQIEEEYANKNNLVPGKFVRKRWQRDGGGGGEMSVMKGNVFEKVGVNISTVFGEFSDFMMKEIPGAKEDPKFFATGVSLVSHMKSPHVPAAHFNTRYIATTKDWFGGGGDLTPLYPNDEETFKFHENFKNACDKHNPEYYPKFKKECDEYFFLHHRGEPRGVGGIFYDYLNTGDFEKDFAFTKDVGLAFLAAFPEAIRPQMHNSWSDSERRELLVKRGRYVEFNLLHDRGTKFGLMTGGNVDAILMSMPPEVLWD